MSNDSFEEDKASIKSKSDGELDSYIDSLQRYSTSTLRELAIQERAHRTETKERRRDRVQIFILVVSVIILILTILQFFR